jgi:hypothetical protein
MRPLTVETRTAPSGPRRSTLPEAADRHVDPRRTVHLDRTRRRIAADVDAAVVVQLDRAAVDRELVTGGRLDPHLAAPGRDVHRSRVGHRLPA